LEYLTLFEECECIAARIHPSYRAQYADVAAMMSIPSGMPAASIDDLYSYMELKKKRFERMEQDIRQGSAMESDAPVIRPGSATAPALPAGCSQRAPDIPRTVVDLSSLKTRKRKANAGPLTNAKNLLQAQLTPETRGTIQEGIETVLSEAKALPITFAESLTIRARQEKYLAFGLFVLRQAGFPVNGTFIAEAYTEFQDAEKGHTNWFLQNPKWLVVLWKHASLAVEVGSQQSRTCQAAWKKEAAHIRKLLEKSTDWLSNALDETQLPSAALSAIRVADPTWPLFGEAVDKACLLNIIPESVLLREYLRLGNCGAGGSHRVTLCLEAPAAAVAADDTAARTRGAQQPAAEQASSEGAQPPPSSAAGIAASSSLPGVETQSGGGGRANARGRPGQCSDSVAALLGEGGAAAAAVGRVDGDDGGDDNYGDGCEPATSIMATLCPVAMMDPRLRRRTPRPLPRRQVIRPFFCCVRMSWLRPGSP
jgi:hypothetical protein